MIEILKPNATGSQPVCDPSAQGDFSSVQIQIGLDAGPVRPLAIQFPGGAAAQSPATGREMSGEAVKITGVFSNLPIGWGVQIRQTAPTVLGRDDPGSQEAAPTVLVVGDRGGKNVPAWINEEIQTTRAA